MIKSFGEFLTESKNKHLDHIEDRIILNGSDGGREAVLFLRSLRDMLAGHSVKTNVTTKFDGAPAIIAGINPENNKFFVGTKGVFAKSPKLNYTNEDIERNHGSGGLADKLKDALKYLPELKFKGIFQGDFLFSKDDLSEKNIDGINYITFKPNTILYAVPEHSDIYTKIKRAKIGIVVHTRYTGKTLEDSKASYDISASEFKASADIWLKDAQYKDVSGTATFTEKEYTEVSTLISEIGKKFNKINGKLLGSLQKDENIKLLLLTFNNTKVRKAEKIKDTSAHAKEFIAWVKERYTKEIEKLKQDTSKQKRVEELLRIENTVEENFDSFKHIFDLQNMVVDVKEIILKKLNQVQDLHTFTQLADGSFKVVSPEGFVATDNNGNTVKLVDRLEFSFNNFTAIKTWH